MMRLPPFVVRALLYFREVARRLKGIRQEVGVIVTRMIFATGNQGKLREIQEIFTGLPYEIVSMKEAGFDILINENGSTFEENSRIKAETICRASGEITLADDSGLVVDALDGQPGIYSARWMGEDTSYHIKNAEILKRLKDVPRDKRTARFVCAATAVFPDGRILSSKGVFEGIIGYEEKGENGFGYDPIFYVPERDCYSAELFSSEKNAISHRGQALEKMKTLLQQAENG